MDNKYRIRRSDPKNIVIEKFGDKNWNIISYHGNSLNSLVSGLFELIMAQYTPETEKLSEQLVGLELALVSGIEKVEKMIKEWCDEKD